RRRRTAPPARELRRTSPARAAPPPAGPLRDRSPLPPAGDPRPLVRPAAKAPGRSRARPRAAPGTPGSCRPPSRPPFPDQAPDRGGEPLPHRALLRERTLAAPGQLVDAPPPAGIGRDPAAGEQARMLEPVQHRIDRALRQVECARAPALDFLD